MPAPNRPVAGDMNIREYRISFSFPHARASYSRMNAVFAAPFFQIFFFLISISVRVIDDAIMNDIEFYWRVNFIADN